jgi:hypothetical protein
LDFGVLGILNFQIKDTQPVLQFPQVLQLNGTCSSSAVKIPEVGDENSQQTWFLLFVYSTLQVGNPGG